MSLDPGFSTSFHLHSLTENPQEGVLTASEDESNTDGAISSEAASGIYICNVAVVQHQASARWAYSVALREYQALGAWLESEPTASRLVGS